MLQLAKIAYRAHPNLFIKRAQHARPSWQNKKVLGTEIRLKHCRSLTYTKHCISWSKCIFSRPWTLPSAFSMVWLFVDVDTALIQEKIQLQSRSYGHGLRANDSQHTFHRISNVDLTSRGIVRCSTPKLTVCIVRSISEHAVYSNFLVTAALFKVVQRFPEMTLNDKAVFLQRTLEQ